jgi:hypothetical protein
MNNHTSFFHWRALARSHHSGFLLAAQFASLVLYAAFDGTAYGRALLSALGVLVLPLTVWVVNGIPDIRWIACSPRNFSLLMMRQLNVNL